MSVISNERQTASRISSEVVSMIAARAALRVEGVSRLNEKITDNLTRRMPGREYFSRGVKVSREEDGLNIDIYADVYFGVRIPDIAWDIQRSVKDDVESVTDENVNRVNIHIQGVTALKARSSGRLRDDRKK